MPIGRCRLCLTQNVQLRDSHFMSAGFCKRHPRRLELGPYEEPLRLFLLELAGFPSDALMIVSITSAMDRMRNMLMTFPFLKSRQPSYGSTASRFQESRFSCSSAETSRTRSVFTRLWCRFSPPSN
jgi:hypothetical protein